MQQKPKYPALAAARIWAITIATGPLFFLLFNWFYQLQSSRIPMLQAGQPDYISLYSNLLVVGLFVAILPFFITWTMLSVWKRQGLSTRMMGERLLLLALLFTAAGVVFLMGQIGTQHPIKDAVLLLAPYFLAAMLGLIRVLGWPWKAGGQV